MIERALDQNGNVLHDCAENDCAVSWDGFARRPIDIDELFPDVKKRPANAKAVAKGERVPNGADPDAQTWSVRGNVARLNRREE